MRLLLIGGNRMYFRFVRYGSLFLLLFTAFLTGCGRVKRQDEPNFLGGYGALQGAAYAPGYTFCLFQDDIYFYFDDQKINRETGQAVSLCNKAGCEHVSADCLIYQYRRHVFPCEEKVYYTKGKNLYTIEQNGKTELVAAFDVDAGNRSLRDDISIEYITPLGDELVYVHCGEGSCFYNTLTEKKVYAMASFYCSDEIYTYYTEFDKNGIHRIKNDEMSEMLLEGTDYLRPVFCLDGFVFCCSAFQNIVELDASGNMQIFLQNDEYDYEPLGEINGEIYCIRYDQKSKTSCNRTGELITVSKDKTETLIEENYGSLENATVFVGTETSALMENREGTYKIQIEQKEGKSEFTLASSDMQYFLRDDEAPKNISIRVQFFSEETDPVSHEKKMINQTWTPVRLEEGIGTGIFSYLVTSHGYTEDRVKKLCLFLLGDGEMLSLSRDGKTFQTTLSLDYEDGISAETNVIFQSDKPIEKLMFGYYISDHEPNGSWEEYREHRETVFQKSFSCVNDGYKGSIPGKEIFYADREFKDVYTEEEDDDADLAEAYQLALLSDRIPIGQQIERWKIDITGEDNLYAVYHDMPGEYEVWVLMDDAVVNSFTVVITKEKNTACIPINSVLSKVTGQEQNIKLLIYSCQTERISLSQYQVLIKK